MGDHAKLDALIHGKQQCVSFRHAATLLQLPARAAQAALASYAHAQPAGRVSVMWIVTERNERTGVARTALTACPPAPLGNAVWAVGPSKAAHAPAPNVAWLSDDALRERRMVQNPTHVCNELRDGRYNALKSPTSCWDTKMDPRLQGDTTLATKKSGTSSFLSMVKAKSKGKKNTKPSSFSFKTAPPSASNSSSSNLFASTSLVKKAAHKIKSKEHANQTHHHEPSQTSLPSQKKPTPPTETNRSSSARRSKTRKKPTNFIIESDSDSEAKESDEDIHERRARVEELEREVAEKERADAERAELEKELMDLNAQDNAKSALESNESQQEHKMMEAAQEEAESKFVERSSRPNKKRDCWDTLKDAPVKNKRTRKEVQLDVHGKDYIVTRMVGKVFDNDGNEVKEDDNAHHAANNKQKNSSSAGELPTAWIQETSERTKRVRANGRSFDKEKSSGKKRSQSKTSGGAKTRVKTGSKSKTRSIGSYFKKNST